MDHQNGLGIHACRCLVRFPEYHLCKTKVDYLVNLVLRIIPTLRCQPGQYSASLANGRGIRFR